jgi:hypothetical protein
MHRTLNDKEPDDDYARQYLRQKLKNEVAAGDNTIVLPESVVSQGPNVGKDEAGNHKQTTKYQGA